MTLNAYAAQKRLQILDDLKAGLPPREGRFDEGVLREARTKGGPQLGATRYTPDSIRFEIIFPDPKGASVILTVTLDPPERVVFLPVPDWVVESIWQGEIDGSYQFESDARRMLDTFAAALEPAPNALLFGARQATGKS